MNAVVEMIKNRASIRRFTDELLTDEEMQALMDAALAAPSGANLQNWHFSFVEDKNVVNEIETYLVDRVMAGDNEFIKQLIESRGRRIFFNAAVVVFISTKDGESLVDAGQPSRISCWPPSPWDLEAASWAAAVTPSTWSGEIISRSW